MKTKLFGVFDDGSRFDQLTDRDRYDAVVETANATVGVSDVALGEYGRTSVHRADDHACVVWGEAFFRGSGSGATAASFYEAYAERGTDALDGLNGSYLAFVEHEGEARLFTDPIRSWECYYTDAPGSRVFGTDSTQVARAIDAPTTDRTALSQFTHFGNLFDDRTLLCELDRIPFDGYLGPESEGELDRFVYQPREFDYAGELAERLERALERRSNFPGETGLLLSAGYDSRIILSQIPGIDRCYSIGAPDADEVRVARKLTDQYEATHVPLEVDDRYLDTSHPIVESTQGTRESLHIHHRGNNGEIDVDTIFHGMFFDTLLRGYFLPRDGIDMFGHTFPRDGLETDPDPARHYAELIGCFPDEEVPVGDRAEYPPDTSEAFARDTIEPALERCYDRTNSVHNAIDLLGIKLKPTLPFRVHLADHYVESFVACDAELLEWHLATPPAYRNDSVYLSALEQIDDDVLRHRPPNRPHDSFKLNQIEKFLRRTVPGLTAFETPWPDRDDIYDRNDMDERLFGDAKALHPLSPRIKLRIKDAESWLDATVPHDVDETEILCPF